MSEFLNQQFKGYHVQELIGEGGFAAVYRAHQPIVDRSVALKVIHPYIANRQDFIRRFDAEAKLVARLEHPNIVPLYDYWRDPDGAYLAMRWMAGNLREHMATGQPWAIAEVNRLLSEVVNALIFAHRYGVVHRDIKPENILLDQEGRAYLSDFGIAQSFGKLADESDAASGSLDYASPEQLKSEPTSPQSDQYSLGMILFELLTGCHPKDTYPKGTLKELIEKRLSEPVPSVREHREELPGQIDDILQRATAVNPQERFPDVLMFADSFRDALLMWGKQQSEVAWLKGQSLNKTPGGTVRTLSGTDYLDEILPAIDVDKTIVNPYRGLAAYQEADNDVFFGRSALTDHVLTELGSNTKYNRFLAVVGPSGSGKSSLVKAGVIPALRQGRVKGSNNWFIAEMVPGAYPFEELEAALLKVAPERIDNLDQQLRKDERGFLRSVKQVLPDDKSDLFLVIDQFEELFTLVENESETKLFLEGLFAAINDPHSRLRVLITLRADFYDRPLMRPRFSQLMQQRTVVVIPMTAEELEQVIVGPAQRVGINVESSLITEIVSEVSQQPVGALPLLQYTLTELFDKRDNGIIRLKSYQDLGGVSGALAQRAEEIYDELDAEQQQLARQLMLRLITLGEGTEDTRRRALMSELLSAAGEQESKMRNLINHWGQARLITFDYDPSTRAPTVEVAHEALIREWQRLRVWLDDSREDLRLQRALGVMSKDWHHGGRDTSFLLRGARLEQFEEWAASTDLAMTDTEQTFMEASIDYRLSRQAAEAERQAHEQQLALQSRRRLRALVGVMAVAAVVGIVLALIAFNQSQVAQDERDNAQDARATSDVNAILARDSAEESQSLALASNAQVELLNNRQDVALALALEANTIANPPHEAEQMLVDAAFGPGTVQVLNGHSAVVKAVELSPDGTHLFSASGRLTPGSPMADDNIVRVWDIATGEPLQVWGTGDDGFADAVSDIVISSDGTWLIASSFDGTVRRFNIESGEEQQRITELEFGAMSLSLSDDNQQLLVGGQQGFLGLWDLASGEMIRQFEGHARAVVGSGFVPNSNRILSISNVGQVFVWDVDSGELVNEITPGTALLTTLDISDDGETVLIGGLTSFAGLYDIVSGELIQSFVGHQLTVPILAISLSPDNTRAITVAQDNAVIVWDVASGQRITTLTSPTSYASLVISHDGSQVITGALDGSIRLWNVNGTGEIQRFDSSLAGGRAAGLTINPNQETFIAASGIPGNWYRADLDSGEILDRETEYVALSGPPSFSPDGRYALLSGADPLDPEGPANFSDSPGTLILWDVEAQHEVRRYEGHSLILQSVLFMPDGETIVTTSNDGYVRLYDLDSGDLIRQYGPVSTGNLSSAVITPDGKYIVAPTLEGIHIWDFETTELTRVIDDPSVSALLLNEDGTEMIYANSSGTLIVRDFATGEIVRELSGHEAFVGSIFLESDDSLLYTGSSDGTVRIWDYTNGIELRRLNFNQGISFVRPIRTRSSLLIQFADGTIAEWGMPPLDLDALIDWAREHRYIPEFSCAQREQFRIEPLCEQG